VTEHLIFSIDEKRITSRMFLSHSGAERRRDAELCREDAIRAGITLFDLERAAKGGLSEACSMHWWQFAERTN
jgi:hypothetical protein